MLDRIFFEAHIQAMKDVRTTECFSTWVEELGPEVAEHIAAALDVATTASTPDELPEQTVLLTAYDRRPDAAAWADGRIAALVKDRRLRHALRGTWEDLRAVVEALRGAAPEEGWTEQTLLAFLSSLPAQRRLAWTLGMQARASSLRRSQYRVEWLLKQLRAPPVRTPLREIQVSVGRRTFRVILAWGDGVSGVVFLHGEEMREPFDGFAGIRTAERLLHELMGTAMQRPEAR